MSEEIIKVIKKRTKKPKKQSKRFIKVRVLNREGQLIKGSKLTDIVTNEANGKRVVLQDGAEVELSEYAYSNLKDAIHTAHLRGLKKNALDPTDNTPVELIPKQMSVIDVFPLTDFYKKDKDGNPIIKETVGATA